VELGDRGPEEGAERLLELRLVKTLQR
jgi:hypothetical protein